MPNESIKIDAESVGKGATHALKLAVIDVVMGRYLSESQTMTVIGSASSVTEAADDLIDYAKSFASAKYMYAMLNGIDPDFTRGCVETFIQNNPVMMETIRANNVTEVRSVDNVISMNDTNLVKDSELVLQDDMLEISDGDDVATDDGETDFILDPNSQNGIKWIESNERTN